MKIKKIIAAAAASAMLLTAASCSSDGDGSANAGNAGNSADGSKVYNIGICQLVEHPALDSATEGFMAALTEKLGEGSVKFDTQNAQLLRFKRS